MRKLGQQAFSAIALVSVFQPMTASSIDDFPIADPINLIFNRMLDASLAIERADTDAALEKAQKLCTGFRQALESMAKDDKRPGLMSAAQERLDQYQAAMRKRPCTRSSPPPGKAI